MKHSVILLQTLGKVIIFTLLISTLLAPVALAQSEEDDSGLMIYEGVGGDFTLTSHRGTPASLKDYQGKVVLLFFGYTHCPDICPVSLSYLQQLMGRLGQEVDQVQTLFISVDPERDTPEHLKNYITHFHSSFVGLTGSAKEIAQVAYQYRAAYVRQEVESVAGYFFAHTDYIYLIDKIGRVRALYRAESNTLEQMTEEIQRLIAVQNS